MKKYRFSDLKFVPHPLDMGGEQAELQFDNGYGVSVLVGPMFYSTEDGPYELAVIKGDYICYDTPITDDVLGYLTEDEVEELLNQVAELPDG